MNSSVEVDNVQGKDLDCGIQAGLLGQEKIRGYLDTVKQSFRKIKLGRKSEIRHSNTYPHQNSLILPGGVNQRISHRIRDYFCKSFPLGGRRGFYRFPDHCTDVVVSKPDIVIGHNNDSSHEHQPYVTAVKWTTERGTVLTVGAGTFMSVGVGKRPDGYVIALSGNELSQNSKTGIPRSLVALAILDAKNFPQAIETALNPERASSYNNIIADTHQVLCIKPRPLIIGLFILMKKGILPMQIISFIPK